MPFDPTTAVLVEDSDSQFDPSTAMLFDETSDFDSSTATLFEDAPFSNAVQMPQYNENRQVQEGLQFQQPVKPKSNALDELNAIPETRVPIARKPGFNVEPTPMIQEQAPILEQQASSAERPSEGYSDVGQQMLTSTEETLQYFNDVKNKALRPIQEQVIKGRQKRANESTISAPEPQSLNIIPWGAINEGFLDSLLRMPERERFKAQSAVGQAGYLVGNIGETLLEFSKIAKIIPPLTKLAKVSPYLANIIRTSGSFAGYEALNELAQKDPEMQGYAERMKESAPTMIAFGVAPLAGVKLNAKDVQLLDKFLGYGYKLTASSSAALLADMTINKKSLAEALPNAIMSGGMSIIGGGYRQAPLYPSNFKSKEWKEKFSNGEIPENIFQQETQAGTPKTPGQISTEKKMQTTQDLMTLKGQKIQEIEQQIRSGQLPLDDLIKANEQLVKLHGDVAKHEEELKPQPTEQPKESEVIPSEKTSQEGNVQKDGVQETNANEKGQVLEETKQAPSSEPIVPAIEKAKLELTDDVVAERLKKTIKEKDVKNEVVMAEDADKFHPKNVFKNYKKIYIPLTWRADMKSVIQAMPGKFTADKNMGTPLDFILPEIADALGSPDAIDPHVLIDYMDDAVRKGLMKKRDIIDNAKNEEVGRQLPSIIEAKNKMLEELKDEGWKESLRKQTDAELRGVIDEYGMKNIITLDEFKDLIVEKLELKQKTNEVEKKEADAKTKKEAMEKEKQKIEDRFTKDQTMEAKQKLFDDTPEGKTRDLFNQAPETPINDKPKMEETDAIPTNKEKADFNKDIPDNVEASMDDYNKALLLHKTRIKMPEMFRFIKGVPIEIKEKFGNLLGAFYPTQVKLAFSAAIFKDEMLASKVFAHEIGHFIDYSANETMNNGNELGRLSGLKGFMDHTLKESPESTMTELTETDRARLRKEAESLAKASISETEITETVPIYEKSPITPQDITNIWNDMASREKTPELFEYVQRLSAKEKVAIVKKALAGIVDEDVQKLGQKKIGEKTVTRKQRVSEPLTKEQIKQKYRELLKEEIRKRKLYELENIRNEMKALSFKWRPVPNGASQSYIDYRNNSKETYADFVSVLFNDPELALRDAPNTFKAFFAWLETRPSTRDNFLKLMDDLTGNGENIHEQRDASIREMFRKGETLYAEKAQKNKDRSIDLFRETIAQFFDKNATILSKIKKDYKKGIYVNPDDNLHYLIEESPYINNIVGAIFRKFEPTRQRYLANGSTDEDLGVLWFHRRVLTESKDKANPDAFSPETSQEEIDKYKETWGEEKYNELWDAIDEYNDIFRENVIAPAKDLIRPETYEKIMNGKDEVYGTFQVLNYILEGNVSSGIIARIGTMNDIANMLPSTMLKTVAMVRATNHNMIKKSIAEQLSLTNEIDMVKVGKDGFVAEKEGKGILKWKESGTNKAGYVDPYITRGLEVNSDDFSRYIANVMSKPNSFFRGTYILYNVGFQSYNLIKDFLRTWKGTPGLGVFEALKGYIENIGPARARALGIDNATINEMKEKFAIGLTYNDIFADQGTDASEAERLAHKYDAIKQTPIGSKNIAMKAIFKVMEKIKQVGDTIETLPKVVAWKKLKARGMNEKEAAHYVRTRLGTPNIKSRGLAYNIYNNLVMFSNVIKEGWRGDFESSTDPATRNSFWAKQLSLIGIPAMLYALMYSGVFDDKDDEEAVKMSTILKAIPSYDRSNYICIPYDYDEQTQTTAYIRLPLDETSRFLYNLTTKMIYNATNEDKDKLASDLFSYGIGQIPGLSPSIKMGAGAVKYLSGKNIHDYFYNSDVFTDDEMAAGGLHKLKKFVKWEYSQTGLPLKADVFSQYNTDTLAWKVIKKTPIISRFFKRSNTGITESSKETAAVVGKDEAQLRLDIKDEVQKSLKLINDGESTAFKERGRIVKLFNIKDRAKITSVQKQIVAGNARLESPYKKAVILANTSKQKQAIVNKMYTEISKKEADQLVREMHRKKILPKNIRRKLAKKEVN